KVDRLRDELKISDSMANGSAPAPLITAEQFRELSSMRIQQEADYNSQATLLENLKSMDSETLRKALPTAVSDTQLNELLSDLNLAQQNLIRLGVDYTPDHPKYKNAQQS